MKELCNYCKKTIGVCWFERTAQETARYVDNNPGFRQETDMLIARKIISQYKDEAQRLGCKHSDFEPDYPNKKD